MRYFLQKESGCFDSFCLRFENFQENNCSFFNAQFTSVSFYWSIQPLTRQPLPRNWKKNKNLDAFQNDPSEIQCVVNFAYTKDIDRQFKFKGHCEYFYYNSCNDQIINPLLSVLFEHVVFSVCFSFC